MSPITAEFFIKSNPCWMYLAWSAVMMICVPTGKVFSSSFNFCLTFADVSRELAPLLFLTEMVAREKLETKRAHKEFATWWNVLRVADLYERCERFAKTMNHDHRSTSKVENWISQADAIQAITERRSWFLLDSQSPHRQSTIATRVQGSPGQPRIGQQHLHTACRLRFFK